jgi:hypothetical protein
MAQVIIITKPGYDALTETDAKNFIFDSRLNHLKTGKYGTVEITVNASSAASTSVVHGLGNRPLCLAYFRDKSDVKWFVPMTQMESTNTRKSTLLNVEVYVTDTRVYFNAINRTASQKTVEIMYEAFYEGDA